MNFKSIFSIFSLVLVVALSSCTKCYECSYTVETVSNGQTYVDTVSNDHCTADPAEIDEIESQGQTCVATI